MRGIICGIIVVRRREKEDIHRAPRHFLSVTRSVKCSCEFMQQNLSYEVWFSDFRTFRLHSFDQPVGPACWTKPLDLPVGPDRWTKAVERLPYPMSTVWKRSLQRGFDSDAEFRGAIHLHQVWWTYFFSRYKSFPVVECFIEQIFRNFRTPKTNSSENCFQRRTICILGLYAWA